MKTDAKGKEREIFRLYCVTTITMNHHEGKPSKKVYKPFSNLTLPGLRLHTEISDDF